MSNYVYHIGVDIAQGGDYTMYCVYKSPNWLKRLINKLLHKPNTRKIIYMGDDERIARKYIRKHNAQTVEGI